MRRLWFLVFQFRVWSKGRWKKLAFEEGVQEDEPEFFFRGGKEEWQKFCETTLAKDRKEREPVWQEAILLLILLTKEVLALLMVLEHRSRACTNKALECGVWWSFHCLKRWFLFLTAFAHCELSHFGNVSCPV